MSARRDSRRAYPRAQHSWVRDGPSAHHPCRPMNPRRVLDAGVKFAFSGLLPRNGLLEAVSFGRQVRVEIRYQPIGGLPGTVG